MNTLNLRQALLKRMSVMARKLLLPEILRDLEALSTISDNSPFSKSEYLLIRQIIVERPYYGSESIFDRIEFFTAIRGLSDSLVIRLLRSKVAYAILARCRNSPNVSNIAKSFENLVCLYL
jgi:hypothetical protein